MSIHTVVFVKSRTELRDADKWANAILAHGYSYELDRQFDVNTSSGHRPGKYFGAPAGFEYYCDEMEDYLLDVGEDDFTADLERLQVYALAVDFVTHSRTHDRIAAVISAAVLAAETSGLLLDCETGKYFSGNDALKWAESRLAHLKADLSEGGG